MPMKVAKGLRSITERRYREFFENSSDAIFLMDVTQDGRFRFGEINPADEKLIGLTNDEVAGKYVEEISPNEQVADVVIANFSRCVAEGRTLSFEETLDFSLGPRHLHTTLIPVRDDNGNIYRIAGIVRDLTEQKRASEQFALLNFALNHVRESAFLIDEKARFHYVNDEACRALGYEREELLRLGVSDVDPDFPEERWPEHWRDLRESGTRVFEGRHKTRDGQVFPVEINASYFEFGGRGYNLALVRNITERKLDAAVNVSRLHLVQFSLTHTLDELLEETLNEAEKLTGSLIGFYHSVDEDQTTLTLQNWSTRTKAVFCKAEGKGQHYPIAEAGVWTDCVRERKAVIHNDYAALPHRKGMPEGHATVVRELVVPVYRGEKISAILGVGNKPTDYTDKDIEVVSLLADLAWETAERKAAEEQLHQREQEFRALAENAPDPIVRYDRDGRRLYVNPAVLRLSGKQPSTLLGSAPDDAKLVASREGAKLLRSIRQVVETGQPVEEEVEFFEPNGKRHYFHNRFVPEWGRDGAVASVLSVSSDITSVVETQRQLHTLVENLPDMVARFDTGGRFLYVSPQVTKAFGLPEEHFLGKTPCDIASPEERETNKKLLDSILRAIREGVPNALEIQWRLPGGAAYQEIHHIPEKDDSGNVVSVLGVARDITERKHAEQQRRMLDFAMNHVDDSAFLIDRSDARFLYVNEAACHELGYTREELVGMTIFDIDPDYTPEVKADIAQRAEAAGSVSLERRHKAKDGRIFPVEIHTSIFEYGGKTVSIALARDITERKQAEAKLRLLNETLEQRVHEELAKNREKDHLLIQQSRLAAMGEMVHNIAHQWRQPINVLSILLSNLEDSYDYGELTKDELHEAVSKGKQIVQSMSSTINDFRDFFKPGKEKGRFSVGRCLHEVEGILGAALSNQNIDLTDGIDETVCAHGYANEFAQVLLNVINNAKEAIVASHREGGWIRVHAAERDGMIEVYVSDNGGGIPEDVLPKIFDPYFTTKDKGSGIGLYMSKMIIESNMNGQLSARNIENGAEVVIRIPAS